MMGSIRKRLVAVIAVVIALCAVGSGAAATREYRPFVTDFPKADSYAPAAFIPGVTDFGVAERQPGGSFVVGALAPTKPVGNGGLDWGDVGAGAGMGIAFTVLIAGGAVAIARRRSTGPLGAARVG
jgi:hypothetical protein